MKIVFSSNRFKSSSQPLLSRVLFYSTKTPTPTPKAKKDTLFSWIYPIRDPRVSIVPILNQWLEEGKSAKKEELSSLIKMLRDFKRFQHALEISQWISDKEIFVLSPSDIAVRLDLISRIHGIEQADKYINNIPKKSQVFPVYLALLNCYAHGKFIDKAEALMQEMRELGFARTSLAYNVLLNLYTKVGQYEKLDTLMEEMKEKGVEPNKYTFSIRLNAYAVTSDIDGMEKTLQMMEIDPKVVMDWNCYAIAAKGYIKAGLIEKALEMLKKSEELVTGRKKMFAYDFLLELYADTGKKEELYRIWNQYKSSEKVYNTAYRRMLGSLLKLDDIAGAEKILEDWESGDTSYDFQVPNMLIVTYCKNGLLEKAEMLVDKAKKNGKKPFASTWEVLATGYIEGDQIPKAVEAIKAGFLTRRPGWKPNRDTLAACLVYLKQQGDTERAEEFVRLLGAPGHMSIDDCERLLDYIYIHNTEEESAEVNQMDRVTSDDDDETDEIAKEAT